MIYTIIFMIFAALAIIMALATISTKKLIYSTIYLFVLLLVFSSIFIFLGSSFVGSVEILVYTGAIIILIVFVLMLTGGNEDEE